MKIAVTIVRVLLGLLFLFSSVSYFLNLFPEPELSGDLKTFNEGIKAAGYLLPLIKGIELVCGLAFIIGRFVPLATVIIFPIAVNILAVHISIAPEGLPVALFVILATLFIAYYNRNHYRELFAVK